MIPELLRIKQWYKNLIVFIPLVFSGRLISTDSIILVVLTFISFCLLSSSVYILNDIKDIKEDRKHPKKKRRPIAAGKISIKLATGISLILLIISLIWSYILSWPLVLIMLVFILFNLIYTYWAKHRFILDTMFIGLNFILRAVGGSSAISVPVSGWLLVFVFIFAMYLAFAKRRSEIQSSGKEHRKNLDVYRIMVDHYLISCATLLIVIYTLYVFATNRTGLILSIPFLMYGIYRHLYLVYTKNIGEDASAVLREKGLIISIIFFGLTVLFAMYFQAEIISITSDYINISKIIV